MGNHRHVVDLVLEFVRILYSDTFAFVVEDSCYTVGERVAPYDRIYIHRSNPRRDPLVGQPVAYRAPLPVRALLMKMWSLLNEHVIGDT